MVLAGRHTCPGGSESNKSATGRGHIDFGVAEVNRTFVPGHRRSATHRCFNPRTRAGGNDCDNDQIGLSDIPKTLKSTLTDGVRLAARASMEHLEAAMLEYGREYFPDQRFILDHQNSSHPKAGHVPRPFCFTGSVAEYQPPICRQVSIPQSGDKKVFRSLSGAHPTVENHHRRLKPARLGKLASSPYATERRRGSRSKTGPYWRAIGRRSSEHEGAEGNSKVNAELSGPVAAIQNDLVVDHFEDLLPTLTFQRKPPALTGRFLDRLRCLHKRRGRLSRN